jgi:peptidoglycan/LPS O-acetylase OafA/YrhL
LGDCTFWCGIDGLLFRQPTAAKAVPFHAAEARREACVNLDRIGSRNLRWCERFDLTKYRSDIDGLRAVAVTSVVLFHAGVGALKGGFVGVDVFFVISGYLITANLHGDLRQGRFSILGFYERRARRILPALFAMMIGAALGAALFLPNDLKLFGESVAAATLSLSNVFFYTHTGYFDLAAAYTPLLHTWSLAVEEQFYLVFPPVLWAVARLSRGRRRVVPAVLGVLWAASFALSLWQASHQPRQAFYLPFDRAEPRLA